MKMTATILFVVFTFVTPPRALCDLMTPLKDALSSNQPTSGNRYRAKGNYSLRTSPNGETNGFTITQAKGAPGTSPERVYELSFEESARQDIYLSVVDLFNTHASQSQFRVFYFFPRKVLPSVEERGHELKVTLPNQEELTLSSDTKKITGGVIAETTTAYDLDSVKEKTAGVEYHGHGVVLILDRRGEDPRPNNTVSIRKEASECSVKSNLLFNQTAGGNYSFLYPTDAAFDVFLREHCGFGI